MESYERRVFVSLLFVVMCALLTMQHCSAHYIIAESDGGLSNRLRTMISHMFLGKVLHNDAQLVMVWDVNDACPGHFLQIFMPLENVTFISNSTRAEFEKHAVKVYPKSRDGFERTMLNYDVNLIVKRRTWWNIELTYWELLKWTRDIDDRVEEYVARHSVCNITSMHIRKTDMDLELNAKKKSGYDHYYKWVDTRPPEEPVYLMTDNPNTQRHFIEKYGRNKIFVYKNISSVESQVPISQLVTAATPSAAAASVSSVPPETKKLAIDHRFTTIEHTIVDILISAHARDFKPAPFSSVSDFERMLNFLHRWKWCGCTFRGC